MKTDNSLLFQYPMIYTVFDSLLECIQVPSRSKSTTLFHTYCGMLANAKFFRKSAGMKRSELSFTSFELNISDDSCLFYEDI